jgi:hypothetical protein
MTRRPKIFDDDDVLELLRSEIVKAGSQAKWAREKGVSRTNVCKILRGYQEFQPKILEALGLKKVNAYTWR